MLLGGGNDLLECGSMPHHGFDRNARRNISSHKFREPAFGILQKLCVINDDGNSFKTRSCWRRFHHMDEPKDGVELPRKGDPVAQALQGLSGEVRRNEDVGQLED